MLPATLAASPAMSPAAPTGNVNTSHRTAPPMAESTSPRPAANAAMLRTRSSRSRTSSNGSLRTTVPTRHSGRRLRPRERHLDLDLDRATTGQRGHADRGAGVTAGGAEDVGEQAARAVDDR